MDQKRIEYNLSGIPQRGIVNPLLFNIYLFELDKFVFETFIKQCSDKNIKVKGNRTYHKLRYKAVKLKEKANNCTDKNKKKNEAYYFKS